MKWIDWLSRSEISPSIRFRRRRGDRRRRGSRREWRGWSSRGRRCKRGESGCCAGAGQTGGEGSAANGQGAVPKHASAIAENVVQTHTLQQLGNRSPQTQSTGSQSSDVRSRHTEQRGRRFSGPAPQNWRPRGRAYSTPGGPAYGGGRGGFAGAEAGGFPPPFSQQENRTDWRGRGRPLSSAQARLAMPLPDDRGRMGKRDNLRMERG